MTKTLHHQPSKMKVMTILGTRPEIIRLSCILPKLDHYFDHHLVHTGQNYDYELNAVFFDDLNLRKPDHFLEAVGESTAQTIGNIIAKADKIMETIKPEALLVLGDTNSCLSVIAAKRRKIPIFHMEAGNRCFDQRVPEETNRRIVDHTSDINLTYSDIAREYLLREGLSPDCIIKTGSPMFEVLTHFKPQIDQSDSLKRLNLKPQQYCVVSAHREENIDLEDNFQNLVNALNQVAQQTQMPLIMSTHPRTRARIEKSGLQLHETIQLMKPLGFFDYVHLQQNAFCVLSDSGTISEESSILNFPAINIREAHERPEAMEETSVIMSGLNQERICQALTIISTQHSQNKNLFRQVSDYSMPNVSDKIVRIIMSYTDYVNRIIWQKHR